MANFCFSESRDKVAAVDFQYVGGGCGMKDLTYFVGSCLDESACEQREGDILNRYFQSLRKTCRDTIRKRSRRSRSRMATSTGSLGSTFIASSKDGVRSLENQLIQRAPRSRCSFHSLKRRIETVTPVINQSLSPTRILRKLDSRVHRAVTTSTPQSSSGSTETTSSSSTVCQFWRSAECF